MRRKIQHIIFVVFICIACLYFFPPASSANDPKPLVPHAVNPTRVTESRQAVQYGERERPELRSMNYLIEPRVAHSPHAVPIDFDASPGVITPGLANAPSFVSKRSFALR